MNLYCIIVYYGYILSTVKNKTKDVFLFVITIIATYIVKGIGKVQEQKECTSSAFGFTHIIT